MTPVYPVSQVTDDAVQTQTVILGDGSQLTFSLRYSPLQQGWWVTSLVYGSFTLSGFRVTQNGNMLHQWRNQIPFGLGCFSDGKREPALQQDFSSGTFGLYILTADEVAAYAKYIAGGKLVDPA